MISKSNYKFCKVNDSEEATKPSNEINDLNTWSLEADDTQAVGKVFYTCIRHGSYKGARLKKIVKDGIFVSYFIPSLRTANVFPVVSLVKLKPKNPDALAGYFIPHRQLYRCGSVKTKICNLLWIQRDSIFVLSSSSHRLVFDLNDLKRDAIYLSANVFSRKYQLIIKGIFFYVFFW